MMNWSGNTLETIINQERKRIWSNKWTWSTYKRSNLFTNNNQSPNMIRQNQEKYVVYFNATFYWGIYFSTCKEGHILQNIFSSRNQQLPLYHYIAESKNNGTWLLTLYVHTWFIVALQFGTGKKKKEKNPEVKRRLLNKNKTWQQLPLCARIVQLYLLYS